jgi:hypothetical protein
VKERKGNSYVLIDATNTQLKRLVPIDQIKIIPNSSNQSQEVLTATQKSKRSTNSSDHFEVQQIVDHKTRKGVTTFRIRWKGYAPSDDTWQPLLDFDDIAPVTRYWNVIHNKRPAGKAAQTRHDKEKLLIEAIRSNRR